MSSKKKIKNNSEEASKKKKKPIPVPLENDNKAHGSQTDGQWEQDKKRRLGQFGGAGEHPLTHNK